MKATGIVRHIDDLGRFVIPKEIRKALHVENGDSLEVFVEGKNIVLRKYCPEVSLIEDVESLKASISSDRYEIGIDKEQEMQKHLQAVKELLESADQAASIVKKCRQVNFK